jgi:amidase
VNNTPIATVDDFRATGIIAQPLTNIIVALEKGDISAEQLVELYMARIDKNGPTLQPILSLNPDVLAAAKLSDQQRTKRRD